MSHSMRARVKKRAQKDHRTMSATVRRYIINGLNEDDRRDGGET